MTVIRNIIFDLDGTLIDSASAILVGFRSAFQTLGLNHPKYNDLIKYLGIGYSILIPLGFALLPIFIYITYSWITVQKIYHIKSSKFIIFKIFKHLFY